MPYSEIEIQKLNIISGSVGNSIYRRIQELNSNARLNYTLRRNNEEKKKYTNRRIEELQEVIGKFEGDLADFVQTAIQEEFYYYDGFYNDRRTSFIQNLVSPNIYEEDIEGIEIDEDAEHESFEYLISHSERDYSHIYEFIEGLALASEYNSFIAIRKEEEKEKEVKQSTYEELLPRKTKSLLFNGKNLNLTERILIANQALNFWENINNLQILDTEKYQLAAYILGNDVNNVRNRINGTRSDKVRETELMTYLESLKK